MGKVAQALGVESYKAEKGSTIILSEEISKDTKFMAEHYGESLVNGADGLASAICSTITDCIQ